MMPRIKHAFAVLAYISLCWVGAVRAQDIPALKSASSDAERARIQQLILDARKEGVLSWAGVFIDPEQGQKLLETFKVQYGLPDLKTEYVYVGTSELVTRVDRLLQARSNTFDIIWTSSWAWYKDLLGRKEIMEYHSPSYRDYTLSKKAGMSVEGYWVSDGYSASPMFNPKALETRGGASVSLASWRDITKPELKGLISIPDPFTSVSAAQTFIGLAKVMGQDWIKALVENKPVLRAKSSQGTGWLASGEFPVTLSHAQDAKSLMDTNVPVRLTYPSEGIVLQPFAPIILRSAPHPAASKLFIDYVRSAQGTQVIMDSGALMFFGRPGVKSPDSALMPAWEDVNVIAMDWDKEGGADAIKAIRTAFRNAGMR